jgi:two-component system NarL family sensor kinase
LRDEEGWGEQVHTGAAPHRADPANHAGHAFLQSLVDAMLSNIAVLDSAGSIILANRAWRAFGRRGGLKLPDAGVGLNYLDVCRKAAPECEEAVQCLAGLGGIIDGTAGLFRLRYEMPVGGADCHFVMTATPLAVEGRRMILVSHEDVTAVVQAQQELRDGAIRLLEGQEQERRQIAREIHDSLCQELTAIKLLSGQLQRAEPDERDGLFSEVDEVTDRAIRMIRTFSFVLHSDESGETDTIEAMKHFVSGFSRRTGLDVSFSARVRRPPSLAPLHVPLLRITQESLSNVHRHSGAAAAKVALREIGEAIVLTVEDDGCGFDPVEAPKAGAEGVGIASMRARARELGGTLTFEPTKTGARLVAMLPLPVKAPRANSPRL